MEPFDTNERVYVNVPHSQTYTVEIGNEFSILCASTGTFSGQVTWINEGVNSISSSVLVTNNLCLNLLEGTPVPEVPFREEQPTGSGVDPGVDGTDTNNKLTPISMSMEEFSVVPGEQVGQLYAYRINNSAVVLGTRKAGTFGASIGIGSVAQGRYQCHAENVNANSNVEITIFVPQSKLKTFCDTYGC